MSYADYQGSMMQVTSMLRFILRDEKRILQQAWVEHGTARIEWRDIPLVEDEK